jgi:hypothetical protein
MLRHIHVVPLAAESLGVRSMCTYVETSDVRMLLDAGVSLCPERFGLPPHPREFRAIVESRRRIAESAEKAEIVTISHYHFDHHTPSFTDWLCNWTEAGETARQIYQGKTVLMKNPKEQINYSQRHRAWMFQRTAGGYAEKLENADGKTYRYGDTLVKFSEPVFHGSEDSFLGWVLMTTIDFRDEKFMFAPDVQGPMSRHTLETILKEKPDLLMIGGPPLYLVGSKVDEQQAQIALKNLAVIVGAVPQVILEHHVLRDQTWREKTKGILEEACKVNCDLETAAGFVGDEDNFLEADRRRLFTEEPPLKDFQKWMRGNVETRRHVKPPI